MRANQVDHAIGANLIVQAAVLAVALAVTVSAPKSNRGIAWGLLTMSAPRSSPQ